MKMFLLQCTDNVQRFIDDPLAGNTSPFSNRFAVSGAVAAD